MGNRVGVIGAALWTERLAAMLERHASYRCSPVSSVSKRDALQLPKVFMCRRLIRVGFRPGVFRPRGIVIDLVCILFVLCGRELVFYWTGSDVKRTIELLAAPNALRSLWSKCICNFLLARSRHCTAAPWLVRELEQVNVLSVSMPFPSPTLKFESLGERIYSRPELFAVLSYVPDHSPDNYNGRALVDVARSLPNIPFRIMGGEGSWCKDAPTNVTFLGWTDPVEAYLGSVVVVRAVKHDAMGGTVREALLCGRHVLYSYHHEHTIKLDSAESHESLVCELQAQLMEMAERFASDELLPQTQGRQWVMGNLGEQELSRSLGKWLETGN